MSRIQRVEELRPIQIGLFTLHAAGVSVTGRPAFDDYEKALAFATQAHKRSGFWVADLLRYGDSRQDWAERLSQAQHVTGLSEKTLKNLRAVGAIEDRIRHVDTVEFSHHAEVAGLTPAEQKYWLDTTETEGWSLRELRLNIRAARRAKVIEGQAVLSGLFRVVYADPPWTYGAQQPSGSTAQGHYPGMDVDQLCALPVAAHTMTHAVLLMWVTAPLLYYATDPAQGPDPYRVIRAWGFEPKTGAVWDKVAHNFGNYFSVRHEHLIVATRGSCTPDRPTPMPDSVFTERRSDVHSEKPRAVRLMIERLWDGPRLELFGREPADGWTVFGNDARLWDGGLQAPRLRADK